MPEDTKPCKPLSIRIGLRRNATQKIEFALTKSCKKVSEERIDAVWILHFALLEKEGNEFTAKVSVDIDLNNDAPGKEKQAEDTAKDGLSTNQTQYILGPVARTADSVTEQPFADEIQTLFTNMDAAAFGDQADGADEARFELLDRAADTREKNMRKLRTRVISVLDVK